MYIALDKFSRYLSGARAGTNGVGAYFICVFILLKYLRLSLPLLGAFAIYPLVMLAGAVSMLPGGLGSREIEIVGSLPIQGVQLSEVAITAVGIRLTKVWFAILSDFISMMTLEF